MGKSRFPGAFTALAVVASAVVATSLGAGTLPARAAGAAVPAPPAGFTTVWSDDFNGTANTLPASSNWLFDLGHGYPGGAANWGTGEIEEMTNSPQNVSLDGSGNLRITPLRTAAGTWTSARIETQRTDFAAPAGGVVRFESRIQLPNVTGAAAQGIWPAFWSLGAAFRGNYTNWPGVGEIDVMENVNGQNTGYGTLHCGVAPGGPCNEYNGLSGNKSGFSPTLQGGFHTYAVELDRSTSPEQLRWYIDGQQFHSVSASQMDATTWNNATHHGFFLILDVAVGGSWPGSPTASTASGVPMVVDYVTVSQKAGGTTPPPASGTRDAYGTIQAESFDSQSGTQVFDVDGGGQKLGAIANGDQARYNGVQFGTSAAHTFVARVASGAATGISGLIEVRLDSATAAPVSTISVAGTGGWQSYLDVPGSLSGVTGTHDVYLTFASGQPNDFVDLDSFTFRH
ncbi:carbohydrate-binding protein [Kineosporia sp. J2-2]|uniref:Carbohydrate-binding protein n=1 Tax=Kineosporia corallincola TaxID=2835133 RepID=A0ABS5TKJ6_9ACTN|nr:carbohydrate-binding protein [Kineosporia corallincola]MBT0771622.1 carbohydrate-binding protein [Kineosporia corallincola]